jgi:hypothetical protein
MSKSGSSCRMRPSDTEMVMMEAATSCGVVMW